MNIHKETEKELDEICRRLALIKAEYRCQKCGGDSDDVSLDWHHVVPRSRGMVYRWSSVNFLCLCRGCHAKWHESPSVALEWFKSSYPGQSAAIMNLTPFPHMNLDGKKKLLKTIREAFQKECVETLPF